MKARELREMTREELEGQRKDLEEELFNLRMRRSIKPLENPLRLREVRRDIARVATILHEDATGVRKLAEDKRSILESGKEENK